ncbi:MAG: Gfo/Idh/MocA family oxidoreductase [Propionicimonas sp.]|uniref:Gfo/Idh/MocA family protein n=1 Tax=Propionicimonas sp. TaxID=1955623 RepID=UPI003D151DBB
MTPVGVGLVGAGNISTQYLTNLATYPDVRVVAVGDLDAERAAAQAEAFGVPSHGGVDAVLTHPDVEVVVNLTVPAAHVELSTRAVRAGRHVWSEKPLGLDRASARALLGEAAAAGVRVCCAPDTVLGPGVQATLRALAAGEVGRPLAALAILQGPGPDAWHPSPEFFYLAGGGPVFDMGPYYLTALVCGLGPVVEVVAGGGRARDQRPILAGPRAGSLMEVEVPTTANVLLRHADGASSVCLFSFDSGLARSGVLEFQGVGGTIVAPDPNYFGGTVATHVGGELAREIDVDAAGRGRGIGVVDLVRSLAAGTPPRADGELAFHVLDVMLAIEESIASGRPVGVDSVPPIPAPLPVEWNPLVASSRT